MSNDISIETKCAIAESARLGRKYEYEFHCSEVFTWACACVTTAALAVLALLLAFE